MQIPSDEAAMAAPRGSIAVALARRGPAAILFAPSLALIIVAAILKPDPAGIGTHEQLGLSPCGFVAEHGIPCISCGMTTSFALMADGRILSSFITQPAGATLALITAMIVLVSGWSLITGASLKPIFDFLWRPRAILWLGALILGAWGYTIFTFHGTH